MSAIRPPAPAPDRRAPSPPPGAGTPPDLPEAARLYLDLLKRSLTNTLFHTEPDANQEDTLRYVGGAVTHYQQSAAVSMLPLARMDNLQFCVLDAVRRGIPGDLIETGVWRGGATIFMRGLLRVLGATDRLVWAADSFEGLPVPDPEKYPLEAKAFNSAAMVRHYKHLAVGLDEVKSNFGAYGMLDDGVRFLKGWFKDTLPLAPIERLAVMRLDGDFYDSTRDALTSLYEKLSVGGYVIIDDYGEDSWTYCRQAVDEFRRERGIATPMERVDKPCWFWRKAG